MCFLPVREDPAALMSSTLSDFQIIRTLGVGEFGHEDLVRADLAAITPSLQLLHSDSMLPPANVSICQVHPKSSTEHVFVMRVLKKTLIVSGGRREHVLRERNVLMETRCPFIVRCLLCSNNFIYCLSHVIKKHLTCFYVHINCRLHKTFRDAEHLYLLTEACLGGDLSCLLKDK